MRIGVLRAYFQIPGAHSLKEKRRVMRSLKDRLFSQFNVSVAEIGSNDIWQAGEIGIVTVGNERRHIDSVMQKVMNFVDIAPDIRVIECDIEII